jgi:hypothetical protein
LDLSNLFPDKLHHKTRAWHEMARHQRGIRDFADAHGKVEPPFDQ